MSSLHKDIIIKLYEKLESKKPVPIQILSSNLYNLPVIFIGQKYSRTLLFPEHITEDILHKIFCKALQDNNYNVITDLMRYICQNGIEFWEKYKHTELGVEVMASVLGRIE